MSPKNLTEIWKKILKKILEKDYEFVYTDTGFGYVKKEGKK